MPYRAAALPSRGPDPSDRLGPISDDRIRGDGTGDHSLCSADGRMLTNHASGFGHDRGGGPPERVFDAYNDPVSKPLWQFGLREIVDATGPLDRVGTHYVMRVTGAPASPVEVIRSERPRYHEERFSGAVTGVHRTSFEPTGAGTRFTYEAETRIVLPLIGPLLERIFAARSQREIRGNVERFKALVERSATT